MTSTLGFSLTSTTPALNLGTKSFQSNDTDMQNVLNWAKVAYSGIITELFDTPHVPGFTPTNTQIGVALSTGTMRGWSAAEQKFRQDTSVAAVPPAPPPSWS